MSENENEDETSNRFIAGINVNIPYPTIYPSQLSIIFKVITALKQKKNAILEVKIFDTNFFNLIISFN